MKKRTIEEIADGLIEVGAEAGYDLGTSGGSWTSQYNFDDMRKRMDKETRVASTELCRHLGTEPVQRRLRKYGIDPAKLLDMPRLQIFIYASVLRNEKTAAQRRLAFNDFFGTSIDWAILGPMYENIIRQLGGICSAEPGTDAFINEFLGLNEEAAED